MPVAFNDLPWPVNAEDNENLFVVEADEKNSERKGGGSVAVPAPAPAPAPAQQLDAALAVAVKLLQAADKVLIVAGAGRAPKLLHGLVVDHSNAVGAGMGCDSGLPDYRSAKGFWRVSCAGLPPVTRDPLASC